MNPKSLTTKIEEEINKPRLSNYSLNELVEEINSSQVLSFFFRQLKDHDTYKKLLFLHRNDLFRTSTEVPIPYFWICDNAKKGSKSNIKNPEVSRALTHILSENDPENTEDKFKAIFKQTLNIDDKAFDDIKDIVAYFFIDFLRDNPELLATATADTFSFVEMKKRLGNYENINLPSSISSTDSKEIDPIVVEKIEGLVLPIVASIMAKVETSMEAVSSLGPPVVLSLHKITKSWLANFLRKSTLEYKEYMAVLDDFYRYKVIENKDTVTWCERCSVDALQYTKHHGALAPSKVSKDKCISCSGKKSFSSIYGINPILKESIYSKDGLLAVYFCWLLKKKNIQFDVNKSVGQYETDFIIKKQILVECKVYKAEKDNEAIKSELDKVVKQLEKHIKQAREKGIEIKIAVLLWNRYKVDSALVAKTKEKFKSLVEDCKFSILTPLQVEQFVETL